MNSNEWENSVRNIVANQFSLERNEQKKESSNENKKTKLKSVREKRSVR